MAPPKSTRRNVALDVLKRFHERGVGITRVKEIQELLAESHLGVPHDDLHGVCRHNVGFVDGMLLQADMLEEIVAEVIALLKTKQRSQTTLLAEVYDALEGDADEEDAIQVSAVDDIDLTGYAAPAADGLERVLNDFGLSREVMATLQRDADLLDLEASPSNKTLGESTDGGAPPERQLDFDGFREWFRTLKTDEGVELGLITPLTTPPATPKAAPVALPLQRAVTIAGLTPRGAGGLRAKGSRLPRVASLAHHRSFVGAPPPRSGSVHGGGSFMQTLMAPGHDPPGTVGDTIARRMSRLASTATLMGPNRSMSFIPGTGGGGVMLDPLSPSDPGVSGLGGQPVSAMAGARKRRSPGVQILNNDWPTRRESVEEAAVHEGMEVCDAVVAASLAVACCSFPLMGYFFWIAEKKAARTRALLDRTSEKAKKEARLRVAMASARRKTGSFGLVEATHIALGVGSKNQGCLSPRAQSSFRRIRRELRKGKLAGGAGDGDGHVISAIRERIRTAKALECYGILDDPDEDGAHGGGGGGGGGSPRIPGSPRGAPGMGARETLAALREATADADAAEVGTSEHGDVDATCGNAVDLVFPEHTIAADSDEEQDDGARRRRGYPASDAGSSTRSFEGHLDAGFHEAARVWGRDNGVLDGAALDAPTAYTRGSRARRHRRLARAARGARNGSSLPRGSHLLSQSTRGGAGGGSVRSSTRGSMHNTQGGGAREGSPRRRRKDAADDSEVASCSSSEDDLFDDLILTVEHVVSHPISKKVADVATGTPAPAAQTSPKPADDSARHTPLSGSSRALGSVGAARLRLPLPRDGRLGTATGVEAEESQAEEGSLKARPWGFGGRVNYLASGGKRGTMVNPAPKHGGGKPAGGRSSGKARGKGGGNTNSTWTQPPTIKPRGARDWQATEGVARVQRTAQLTDLVRRRVGKAMSKINVSDEQLRRGAAGGSAPEAHYTEPFYVQACRDDVQRQKLAKRAKVHAAQQEMVKTLHAVNFVRPERQRQRARRSEVPEARRTASPFAAPDVVAQSEPLRPGTAPLLRHSTASGVTNATTGRRCADPRCASRSPSAARSSSPPPLRMHSVASMLVDSPKSLHHASPCQLPLCDGDGSDTDGSSSSAVSWTAVDGNTRDALMSSIQDVVAGRVPTQRPGGGEGMSFSAQVTRASPRASSPRGAAGGFGTKRMFKKSFGEFEPVEEMYVEKMSFSYIDREAESGPLSVLDTPATPALGAPRPHEDDANWVPLPAATCDVDAPWVQETSTETLRRPVVTVVSPSEACVEPLKGASPLSLGDERTREQCSGGHATTTDGTTDDDDDDGVSSMADDPATGGTSPHPRAPAPLVAVSPPALPATPRQSEISRVRPITDTDDMSIATPTPASPGGASEEPVPFPY